MSHPFYSLYTHGFLRSAVCIPHVRVADPLYNAERTLGMAQKAAASHAAVALFPELGIAAYSNDDLFHQDALLAAVRAGLAQIVETSRQLMTLLVVGAPLRLDGRLFNCAIVIHKGRILGITPKTYLPNYREFYEKRQFTAGRSATRVEVSLLDQLVPFGTDLLFCAVNVEGFKLHAEICEDLWAPIPPSTYAALAGATLLTNLSGSPITIGKADYRREICSTQSGKCIAAYLYAGAGLGESTNDLAWDGHALIYENGSLLAESQRFQIDEQIIMADIDLERLEQERMRLTSFTDSVANYAPQLQQMRHVAFELDVPQGEVRLQRHVGRFPYVPSDPARLNERCAEVYNIQVQGLV
ncbi:MAG: NAD(+) synthase, partial [Caldilineaceae bacterium]|nr:NAD(+) synthase [Caldilineaceae bacterium]